MKLEERFVVWCAGTASSQLFANNYHRKRTAKSGSGKRPFFQWFSSERKTKV